MPLPPPSQAPAQAEEFRFSDYEGLLQHPNVSLSWCFIILFVIPSITFGGYYT